MVVHTYMYIEIYYASLEEVGYVSSVYDIELSTKHCSMCWGLFSS